MRAHSLVFQFGTVTITRIDETEFELPLQVLLPAWGDLDGLAPGRGIAPADPDLARPRVTLRTHLWVVQTQGLVIVVDTGIGNGKSRPFNTLFDRLDHPVLERFAAAGFRRERVDYVMLTHLHVDHVGWCTHWDSKRWTPVFPNATHVFSHGERAYFATPGGAPRRMVFEDSVLPLIQAGLVRELEDVETEVLDGVRFLPTPGHSIGHMAIEIRSRGATALFSGDVMHSPLQVRYPAISSVFCMDPVQARASRQWLLERAARTGAVVFPAHFPQTCAGVVVRGAEGLQWRYLPDPRERGDTTAPGARGRNGNRSIEGYYVNHSFALFVVKDCLWFLPWIDGVLVFQTSALSDAS